MNPLILADTTGLEFCSLFQSKISLFLGKNALIPVLEIPVNFTGICGAGGRNPGERRDLSG